MIRQVGSIAVLLIVAGLIILAAANDDLDKRLPGQVLPRRFAIYPSMAGAALLLVAGIASLYP